MTPPDISSITEVEVSEDTIFYRFRYASRRIIEINSQLFFAVLEETTRNAEEKSNVTSEYLCRLVSLAGDYPEMWKSISEHLYAKINALICEESDSSQCALLAEFDLFGGNYICSGSEEMDEQYRNILNTLREDSLSMAIERSFAKEKFKTAIFENLDSVDSWKEASKAASLLSFVATSLTVTDIEKLSKIICKHRSRTYGHNQFVNTRGVDQALEETFLLTNKQDSPILNAWLQLALDLKGKIDTDYFQGKQPPYGDLIKQVESALELIGE
ncbi:hypothetical protein [Arcanobacterium phocae]|uniref:hypothetical protein n=1 Tax=Arcanobacterium phocae TaxID=131112 RepID=UPI001C0ED00B|nr:hypothetical protein [Arcanobacterium phocae]